MTALELRPLSLTHPLSRTRIRVCRPSAIPSGNDRKLAPNAGESIQSLIQNPSPGVPGQECAAKVGLGFTLSVPNQQPHREVIG